MPPVTKAEKAYQRERDRVKAAQKRIKRERPDLHPFVFDDGLDWMRSNLLVPNGLVQGERLKIYDWQEEWLRQAYSPCIRRASLSIARKNGKTSLIANAILCHLLGPWQRHTWRGYIASLTIEHAKQMLMQIEETAFISGFDEDLKIKKSSPYTVESENGGICTVVSADKAQGHSLAADLVVLDEIGLFPETKRDLVNNMYSAISSRDGKMFCISIQGDSPMFKEIEALSGDDSEYYKRYTVPTDAELDDEQAWYAGNPGLGDIKSLGYMRDAARKAMRNPPDQAYFRAHDLNQPFNPDSEYIVAINDWEAIRDNDVELKDEPVVLGIDLGEHASMTVAVAIGLETGVMEVWAAYPHYPELRDRGLSDGVGNSYELMRQRGQLRTYPGMTMNHSQFFYDVFSELSGKGCEIYALGSDRHRRNDTLAAMQSAGLMCSYIPRGTGASATADGSADVRAFQRGVLRKDFKIKPNMVFDLAITNAVLRFDGAGNPALDKRNQRARMDAVSAGVIAAGLYETYHNSKSEFDFVLA